RTRAGGRGHRGRDASAPLSTDQGDSAILASRMSISGRGPTSPTAPLVGVGGEHALVHGLHLEVIAGPDRGAEYDSRGEPTVLGSDGPNDFVLSDPTVSRFHCELRVVGGRVVVRDLGSRNGTRVGGALLREADLLAETVLVLGNTQIRVRLGGESVHVPL